MSTTDLDARDLTWLRHAISGSDQPAEMVMLHANNERQTRTVMVRFPDGWRRDAVGHQPAGEDMVILSGALSISGATAAAGDVLAIQPRATRSATTAADGTCALVWFDGPGGGWADGPADDAGSLTATPLSPDLTGSITVHDDHGGTTYEHDVDVLWPEARQWAHDLAGEPVPALDGRAVVRHWG
jgi:hypothetical protein